jgi:hypothetical protein
MQKYFRAEIRLAEKSRFEVLGSTPFTPAMILTLAVVSRLVALVAYATADPGRGTLPCPMKTIHFVAFRS